MPRWSPRARLVRSVGADRAGPLQGVVTGPTEPHDGFAVRVELTVAVLVYQADHTVARAEALSRPHLVSLYLCLGGCGALLRRRFGLWPARLITEGRAEVKLVARASHGLLS